jgi:hypothetical protein
MPGWVFSCSCHHAKAATRLRNPTSCAASSSSCGPTAVVRLARTNRLSCRWNGHAARVDQPGWRWWLPAGLRAAAACSAKCRTDSIEIRAQPYRRRPVIAAAAADGRWGQNAQSNGLCHPVTTIRPLIADGARRAVGARAGARAEASRGEPRPGRREGEPLV